MSSRDPQYLLHSLLSFWWDTDLVCKFGQLKSSKFCLVVSSWALRFAATITKLILTRRTHVGVRAADILDTVKLWLSLTKRKILSLASRTSQRFLARLFKNSLHLVSSTTQNAKQKFGSWFWNDSCDQNLNETLHNGMKQWFWMRLVMSSNFQYHFQTFPDFSLISKLTAVKHKIVRVVQFSWNFSRVLPLEWNVGQHVNKYFLLQNCSKYECKHQRFSRLSV